MLIALELLGEEFGISIAHGEYLVDKSSTAKFCVESMSKNLIEALLVMIISMPAGIIDTTDIKHGIQCIKDLLQSSIRNGGEQVSGIARYNTNYCTYIPISDSEVMKECNGFLHVYKGDSTAC